VTDNSARRPSGAVRRNAFDAAIALGSAALSVAILAGLKPGIRSGTWKMVLGLALVHTLCLFWRRRNPWAVLAVNLSSGLAVALLGYPMVVLHLAPLLALYAVASQTPAKRSAWGLAATAAALVLGEIALGNPSDMGTMAGNLVALLATWYMGTSIFSRQEYVRRLEERTKELQEAREDLADQAVANERLRIARELHDVVAHSLSVIAVRAGIGAHVLDQNPEEARTALKTTEEVSRKALDEMRRLLGVLRDGDTASLAPLPGLAELPVLIEGISETGPRVDLHIEGSQEELSAGLDLTAYRIVQESLTNVMKHAGATRARVTLSFAPGLLTIEVVDDGSAPYSPNGSGLGLRGMKERADLFGGTLEVGPLKDGGFRVLATLPSTEAER
jgi:signal transduction histidine kinase